MFVDFISANKKKIKHTETEIIKTSLSNVFSARNAKPTDF